MISFYHKDERKNVILFIVGVLVIQMLVLSFIFLGFLNNINKDIITQNYSIVGTVARKDEDLAKKLVPIITNNKTSEVELGKSILSNYSYDYSLKYFNNPLVPTVGFSFVFKIIMSIVLTILIIVFGFLYIIDPLYKKIKHLTFRSENIVENKIVDKGKDIEYRGSLDKFSIKFDLMEERIFNNIKLLQEEKKNLKNIIDDISHQLKTPLMALVMYNDILKDYKNMDDYDIDNFIELSNEQLDRMQWLVKTLLKYARLESNVVEYHKDNYPLNNTIEESINPLRFKANEKNQTLHFSFDNDIVYYHDRNWLGEAISNIVKNAIEHTPNNGNIEVSLEETPITIRIIIKDNGMGIEKNQIKKIFKRFHKGENALNPTSIGIGLYLSKSIVKAHDGDITVESEVGIGSTFYITFIKTVN
ncbi:MAG: sensor histidine kinase [Peptostreptococcaceae bacterium]